MRRGQHTFRPDYNEDRLTCLTADQVSVKSDRALIVAESVTGIND